jgi:multiple sugar transport system permease protein
MATTTTTPQDLDHLSQAEVAELARAKPSGKARAGMIASYVGMALIVIYCIIPFYWMVVSALRDPSQGRSVQFIPDPVSIENFKGVFAGQNSFGRSLVNSVIVSGTTTILTLLFGIVAAYALARLQFKGKGAVLWVIMACSMFPLIILIPALLKMFSSTPPFQWFPNWINTYQAVIIPGLSFGLPLAVWNLTAFFKQLPVELEQAAMVDGCTPGVAFRKVILPLAAPGVFTTAIIVFIGSWNEFLVALTFLTAQNRQTATVAISKFTGTTGFDTPYGSIMAAGVIVTVPLLVAVLLFQRRIVAGLTAGGVK